MGKPTTARCESCGTILTSEDKLCKVCQDSIQVALGRAIIGPSMANQLLSEIVRINAVYKAGMGL